MSDMDLDRELRAKIADLTDECKTLRAERDAYKQSLYAELDTNLRLRELGGAKPDECMTPFLERVIAERDSLQVGAQVLRNDLDTALGMLADWCVAVNVNGTGWDDWDEYYKDAAYRDGPLRAMLDKAIAEARERRGLEAA